MKRAGTLLICLEVIALIMSGTTGKLPELELNAKAICTWIGFLLPAIIGAILLLLAAARGKSKSKTDSNRK